MSMNNQPPQAIVFRPRIIGLLLAIVVLGTLSLLRALFSHLDTALVETATYSIGGVLFFIAFFALSNKQYRLYAQGAMIGWGIYVIALLASKFILQAFI